MNLKSEVKKVHYFVVFVSKKLVKTENLF